MNLCGGIIGSSEPEMLIKSSASPSFSEGERSPSVSPRGKPLTPSRKWKRESPPTTKTPTSTSQTKFIRQQHSANQVASPGSPLLNPLSKDDMKKSRPRQRLNPASQPSSTKAISSMVKKQESSFLLVLRTTDDIRNRKVLLKLDPETMHLVIRNRDGGEDSKNDGAISSKENIRIGIRDIVRVNIGQKPIKRLGSQTRSPIKTADAFTIVTTKDDPTVYYFEADSAAERDSAVAAITSLMEQAGAAEARRRKKGPVESLSLNLEAIADAQDTLVQRSKDQIPTRATLSPMKRTHIHSGTPTSQSYYSQVQRTPRSPGDQGTETSLAVFNFNAPIRNKEAEKETLSPKKTIAKPSISDVSCPTPTRNIARKPTTASPPSDLLSPEANIIAEISDKRLPDYDDTRDSSEAISDGQDIRDKSMGENMKDTEANRELSVTITDGSVEVTGSEWSESDDWFSSKDTSSEDDLNENQKTEVKSSPSTAVTLVNTDVTVRQQSAALTSIEDGELVSIANQIADPWCTDDICTAALKDVAEACKGIFDAKQNANSEKRQPNENQRAIVEDYVGGVLGAPSAMMNFMAVADAWNGSEKESEKEVVVNRIQNRASKVNGQALRFQSLKSEMTFGASESSEKMKYLQTVSSYDDLERAGKRSAQNAGRSLNGRLESQNLFQQMMNKMVSQGKKETTDEILYYDSDPEDSRTLTMRRGPRRVAAERMNFLEERERKARRRTLSGIPLAILGGPGRRCKRTDDSYVAEVIEAMKNEKMTLMWHPTQTKQNPNRTPKCVKVWIESGVYLIDGTFLLPKLTWIPMFESHLHSKQLNVSRENPETLDLLDVCRVRECETVDRRLHPFARADRSFVIQTQGDVLLFEAFCKDERSRIVNGLKLVIARLASLLMLRDLRAVDEFFGGGSVPGEAPAWANGNKDNSNRDDSSIE